MTRGSCCSSPAWRRSRLLRKLPTWTRAGPAVKDRCARQLEGRRIHLSPSRVAGTPGAHRPTRSPPALSPGCDAQVQTLLQCRVPQASPNQAAGQRSRPPRTSQGGPSAPLDAAACPDLMAKAQLPSALHTWRHLIVAPFGGALEQAAAAASAYSFLCTSWLYLVPVLSGFALQACATPCMHAVTGPGRPSGADTHTLY